MNISMTASLSCVMRQAVWQRQLTVLSKTFLGINSLHSQQTALHSPMRNIHHVHGVRRLLLLPKSNISHSRSLHLDKILLKTGEAMSNEIENDTDEEDERKEVMTKHKHILGSEEMTNFKELCCDKNEMSCEEWQEFKDKVFSENPNCEKAWEATCLKLMYAARNFKLAESFVEYIYRTGQSPNRATLIMYIALCGLVCGKQKQNVIFEIYDQMSKELDLFDSTSLRYLIQAFSHTERWRQCFDFIEMAKLADEPTSVFYSPVVRAAVREGDTQTVNNLLHHMGNSGMEPTIDVFQDLIKSITCVNSGLTLQMLMDMIQKYNWSVCQESVALLEVYFKSSKEKKYKTKRTQVNKSGVCLSCKHHLRRVEVRDAEFEVLQRDILENVLIGENTYQHSSPEEVERFKDFVMENAPFDVVLDALNIAHQVVAGSSTKKPNSSFLKKVVEHFARYQRKRVLVLGRQHMNLWSPRDMNYIHKVAKTFYTDNITKDDPFALYAAIYSGKSCMIVSGDHMRDHKFRLGSHLKETFEQWQRTHQITRCRPLGSNGVHVEMPAKHDTGPQQDDKGWHIPYEDSSDRAVYERPSTWLCVREVTTKKSGNLIKDLNVLG